MTNEERNILKGRLLEAELAHHRIMMGETAREFVDQNGEKVVYFTANIAQLEAYIFRLKSLLGRTPNANAPIEFIF